MVPGRAEPGAAASASASARARWGDLRLRVLSSLVLAPLALGCLWAGGTAWLALVLLIAIGLAVEWWTLCGRLQTAARVGVRLAGLPYLLPGTLALLWLRGHAAGGRLVLLVLLVVWASDIGAYLVGRLVGGPKLAPRISPGKTVSGALGGLLAAAMVGLAAHGPAAVGFAVLLAIVAQLGDLLESAMKRGFGVKDSGRMIPGHGGLLDRLDGLLFAAPVAAVVVALLPGRFG